MNLNDLANIGQVIGAVAVVVSLFYVAHQIRQNTNAVRSATAQAVHEHFANWYQVLASDPVLSQIAAKGLRDYTSLSEQERVRFIAAFMSFLSYSQNAFLKWRQKLLAPDLWLGREFVIMNLVCAPVARPSEKSRLYVWRGIPPLRRERSDEKRAASRRKAARCVSNRPACRIDVALTQC
jgi:hypothetical protein